MSLFDMFKTAPAGAAANPTVPGNNPGAPNPALAANPPAIPPAGVGDASPLEQFKDLWNTKAPTDIQPFSADFSFDPSKVSAAAGKMDFRKLIDPAQASKALAGDTAAFMDLINKVAQGAFGQAVQASGMMAQEAAKRSSAGVARDLPDFIRRQTAATGVKENPFFNDPAVAPVLDSIQRQMAITYPNATAAELQDHTRQYFQGIAQQFVASTGQQVTPVPKINASETDWEKYYNS